MTSNDCGESEAINRLVAAGFGHPAPTLQPRALRRELELFATLVLDWMRAFHAVRSRVNAPLPTKRDERLTELVLQWRAASAERLAELPGLIDAINAAHKALTSLTAEKVKALKELQTPLDKWIALNEDALSKAKKTGDQEAIDGRSQNIKAFRAVKDLLADIFSPQR